MKLKVWTSACRPFLMGGNVHAPIATEVEVGDPVTLRYGINVYVVVSPKGNTFIAEATTGAFVGETVDGVRADLEFAPEDVVQEQLQREGARGRTATPLSPNEFWALIPAEKNSTGVRSHEDQ